MTVSVPRIKVVIFSPSLSAVSGVSTHVNMLIDSMLTKHVDFIHFQVGSEGRKEGALRKIFRFTLSPFQLAALIVKKKPKIVHINTSLDKKAFWRDFFYLIVAQLLGIKVVNQIHGGKLPQVFFKFSVFTWILRRALLASEIVVVLTTEELEAYKNFDAQINVVLVPNAIDASRLLQTTRSQNFDSPLRIVYVGRLVRTKGLFEALEALKLLAQLNIDFTFNIAGGGVDEAELRQCVQTLQLTGSVNFLGPIFGEAKEHLWLDSDVLLFPTYSEGLPYSLLEALAAGCVPVICPVGGIPDVIQDGAHGLFVPLHTNQPIVDALFRLSNDRKLLQDMAGNSRSRIKENYTVSRLVFDFDKIYKGL